jgi:phosphoadenosine phosphosulfate reductase
MHVWLYIWREQAPYNDLYARRLDRIGCFICPSSDMALLHMIAEDYPDLWQGWTAKLAEWQESQGLSPAWVTDGRWRLREGNGEYDDADSHY